MKGSAQHQPISDVEVAAATWNQAYSKDSETLDRIEVALEISESPAWNGTRREARQEIIDALSSEAPEEQLENVIDFMLATGFAIGRQAPGLFLVQGGKMLQFPTQAPSSN